MDIVDQQGLFEKFLHFLQTEPPLPEYLAEEPAAVTPFDPYQMVAEWIALRQEVKQQGKLMQATQQTLQQAVAGLQAENEQLRHQIETHQTDRMALSEQKFDQKSFWQDLLRVVDALDQADAHWQEQIEGLSTVPVPPAWQKWFPFIAQGKTETADSNSTTMHEVLVSNQQGIALIRRSLLDLLRQRQIIPIAAQGLPFDSQTMYAIGRQETTEVPANTVIQEIVRGYFWGNQVLREAQVIVAVSPP